MEAITQQIGLQMNDTKTKFMLNRQVGNKVKEIELMGKKYEKVEFFKYLEAMTASLNDIETEIKSKIAVCNKCHYALGTILIKRSISQSIKIRLYKTIIRPVVTYGTETWTVTYGAETWTVTYGTETWTVTYGAETWTVTYGTETWTVTYGAETWTVTYGTETWTVTYGAETWTVTYGTETWTVTYGAETWTVTYGAGTWAVT
jgi:hypothetical protein